MSVVETQEWCAQKLPEACEWNWATNFLSIQPPWITEDIANRSHSPLQMWGFSSMFRSPNNMELVNSAYGNKSLLCNSPDVLMPP